MRAFNMTQKDLGQAHAQAVARAQFMERDNSKTANLLKAITETHPHINAATALSLAEAGYGHDSPEVQAVSNLQVKADRASGPFGSIGNAFSAVAGGVKAAVRTGVAALDAPRQTIAGGFRDYVHEIKTGQSSRHFGIGEAIGYQPFIDMIQGDNHQFNQSTLGAAIQVNRDTGISVPAALNNNPTIGRDGDVSKLMTQTQQSWFAGPNSLAEKQQVANARAADMTNGRATTYGRAAGALIGLQPGGHAYGIMSWLLDQGGKPGYLHETDAQYAADKRKALGYTQMAVEGGIDAGATFTPADPIGYLSGAMPAARASREYGGPTVDVLLKTFDHQAGKPGEVITPTDLSHAPSYHGTSAKFDSVKSVDSVRGHHNLYGPGFYTTESRAVAQEYTGKGATTKPTLDAMNKALTELAGGGKTYNNSELAKLSTAQIEAVAQKYMPKPAVMGVHWVGPEPPKLLNLDKTAPAALRDNSTLRGIATGETGSGHAGLLAALNDPKASGAKIYSQFRQAMSEQGITADHADELMHNLRTDLMDAGFDGFTHRGGHAVGAGYNHKVSIYFDAANIRVAEHVRKPFVVSADQPPITVEGTRKTVVFENAHDHIMKTKAGDTLATYLSKAHTYSQVANVLGPNAHPATVLRLLDETNPAKMKALLLDEVGKGFINNRVAPTAGDLYNVGMPTAVGGVPVPKAAGILSATLRRPTARWRQLAPSEDRLPMSDPAWSVEQHRRMLHAMRTGKARDVLTPEYIDKNVEQFARGMTDPAADPSVPYFTALNAARDALIGHGISPRIAQKITRSMHQIESSDRNMAIDAHSGAVKNVFLHVDGEGRPVAKAASYAEMHTDSLPMINVKEFNRAASRMSRLTTSAGWDGLVSAGDAIDALFKFMVLPGRPGAFFTRNMTEAQTRLAINGMDSILTRPMDALAWRVADNPDSATSRILGRRDRLEGRGAIDAAGEDVKLRAAIQGDVSRHQRAMEHEAGPWNDPRSVFTGKYPVARKTGPDGMPEENWWAGIRFTYAKWANSPDYQLALKHDPAEAKDLFWGSKYRQRMVAQEPALATRAGSDAWIDFAYKQIQDNTNGNPKLIAAIRDGHLDGVPVVTRNARGHLVNDEKFLGKLQQYLPDLPEYTVTPGTIHGQQDMGQFSKGMDVIERAFFNRAFSIVSAKPMNRFVNSPFMREATWRESIRLAPLATEAERARILANAKAANLSKSMISEIAAIKGPGGNLTAEDVRDLAERGAFNQWQDTVFNSHRKGNWSKSIRMIGPFAAAVSDMYRFYARALVRNPLILHRADIGLDGARQSGFFYADENGQERFAYPFTRSLANIVGVDAAMSGAVNSANLITSGIMPSVGPIASYPLSWILPDNQHTDALRSIIFPYGEPDKSGGLVESLLPNNGKILLSALGGSSTEQKRRNADAIAATAAYLASTGEYGNTADEQARLRKDAQQKGTALRIIQAFATGMLPASPRADIYSKDKTGRAVQIAYIAADYRKMLKDNPDTANQELYKKYGDSVFLAVTGGTQGTGALPTEDAHNLARSHPDVVSKYADVWSFFTDPASPFSFDEFHRQLSSGERQPKSLKDRQVAAQTSLAASMYQQYKAQFGPYPTTEERAYLNVVKEKIKEQYPLWSQKFDVNAVHEKVTQALAAAKDPAFKDSPVTEAVNAYAQARKQVIDWANSTGATSSDTGWGKAKATAQGREYLRQVAAKIIEQVPQFQTMWDRVFSNEMIDDAGATQ